MIDYDPNKNQLTILDQKALPEKEIYHTYTNYREIAFALEENLITGTGVRMYIAMIGILISSKILRSKGDTFRDEIISIIRYIEKVIGSNPISKNYISRLETICSETEASSIIEKIHELSEIFYASVSASEERIASSLSNYLNDNDTILLCSSSGFPLSSLSKGTIWRALEKAVTNGKRISAVCLEGRPDFSGARIVPHLLSEIGIAVSIIPDIHAESLFRKKQIRHVLINAEGMTQEGKLICRNGSSMIARSANHFEIPVICTCIDEYRIKDQQTPSILEIEGSIYDVATLKDLSIIPEGTLVHNYLFDLADPSEFRIIINE